MPDGLGRCGPDPDERLLIEAILLDDESGDAAWRSWRDGRSFEGSHWRWQALMPAVVANVSASVLGDDVAWLKQLRRRSVADTQMRFALLAGVLDVLSGVTAEVMIFKGVALADWVYGPGERTMGDIDIAVDPDRFADVVAAMGEAGWHVTERSLETEFARTATLQREDGTHVDVHRWMLYPRLTRRSESGLWERSFQRDVRGRPVRSLSAPDALVVAILHGLSPRDAGAVRWPIDVARIVAHADRADQIDEFWSGVDLAARELGMGRIVGAGLRFCVEQFGLRAPGPIIDDLEQQPLDRWLAAEWSARRRGIARGSRARWYVDMNRAMGLKPTVPRYIKIRARALVSGGGPAAVAARRWRRFRDAQTDRRRYRRTDQMRG